MSYSCFCCKPVNNHFSIKKTAKKKKGGVLYRLSSSCKGWNVKQLAVVLIIFNFLMLAVVDHATGKEPILLGQSCVLTGPAKNIGLELRAGLLAAFSQINDLGGINGRKVRLISYDDGYEPDRAIRNVTRLIDEEQVFLLIGEVGTPTSKAVVPLIEKRKIPYFAPFTGADFLRNPHRKYVVNVRASYYQEMEALASYLVDRKGLTRIGCFYQNDSYGFSGLAGISAALRKRGLELVARAEYERNTVAVMGGLRTIHQAKPDAIVLVGAYPACAEFIKLSKVRYGDDTVFGNISFVGTESLQNVLGAYGKNVVVSQVVPYPGDTRIPLVRDYVAAMEKYQRDYPLTYTSLEGYLSGLLFYHIASRVEGELTREKFLETMEKVGSFDLGGIQITFGESKHQGMDDIYLTEIYPEISVIQ